MPSRCLTWTAAQSYNSLNFSISASDNCDNGVQGTAIITRINSFLCPSSPLPIGTLYGGTIPGTNIPSRFPGNNYFASVGATCLPWVAGSALTPGIFNIMSIGTSTSVGIRDVTDGTSNTIAFGEWKMGDCDSSRLSIQDAIDILQNQVGNFGSWGDRANSSMPSAGMTQFMTFLQTCQGLAPASIQGGEN